MSPVPYWLTPMLSVDVGRSSRSVCLSAAKLEKERSDTKRTHWKLKVNRCRLQLRQDLQPESYQHMEQATSICRGCIIRQLFQETTRWLVHGCGHISSAYIHNVTSYKLLSSYKLMSLWKCGSSSGRLRWRSIVGSEPLINGSELADKEACRPNIDLLVDVSIKHNKQFIKRQSAQFSCKFLSC